MLDRGDYVRAQILSKKVNARTFAEREGPKDKARPLDAGVAPAAEGTPSLAELRLQYYGQLVRYHLQGNEYLEVCRAYNAMLESPAVAADPARWAPALRRSALFVALAPRSPMQQSLLAACLGDARVAEALPLHARLLAALATPELVPWPELEAALEPALAGEGELFGGERGATRRADLALRVTEHNVHVVSRYYARVSLARLAQLLCSSVDEAEARLSAMVSAKAVLAKLDRPAGTVAFAAAGAGAQPDDLLNAWSAATDKLLALVETTTQKAHKEATARGVALTNA